MNRVQITEAAYTEYTAHDLREIFELLAAGVYLEVLATESDSYRLLGRTVTLPADHGFYNMSAVFAHANGTYAIDDAIASGDATVEYFQYASLLDAHRHAGELLQLTTDDV